MRRRGVVSTLSTLALLVLSACGGETISLGDGKLRMPADGGTAIDRDAARDTGSDEEEDASDEPPPEDASSEPDAETVRFGDPAPIEALVSADASDDDPALTSDLTVLYFNSKRAGGAGREDVWYTTRTSASATWAPPVPASELNTTARETGIALSSDGLSLWFSSDRAGGEGGLDIYVTRRTSRSAPFANIERVDSLSHAGDDLVSAVSSDQRTVYLARRTNEDDDYDLYITQRTDANATFPEPTPIASLNTDAEESDASPTEGGRSLLFTRGAKLQLAVQQADGSYGPATALSELNSSKNERDPWATDDLRYLVFSSNRTGTYLLYEARR